MSIIQTFKLNLIPDSSPIVINCDQYDKGTGRLVIKLYEDDIAYTPTGTAIIQGSKPDGHGFAYPAALSGNTVTADLTEQMTAVAGRVRCQVVVTESTGRTGTFVFILDVQRSALPSDSDMSESDYQIIEQAIEDSEAWAVGERGGVPVSGDDPTYHNNSKYWADVASQYAQGGIIFKGSVLFANIPTVGMTDGDMYNITNDFTTDSRFEEGAGIQCKAGTNIVWNSNSKWDLFATAAIGSLDDLNDVSITSVRNGHYLKYDSVSGKWENVFIDYLNTNLQSLDEFVQNTDNWNEGHNYAQFFKIKDVNNIFGLGANAWLKGFVVYQNRVDDAYGNVGGTGIYYISNNGQPYNFYIYGDGSAGSPYVIQTAKVTVGVENLDDLSNVTITTPTDGQALIYDSNTQKWKNGAGGGGSSTLAGLTDVDITSATDGQVLMFDGNANEWVNGNGGGGSSTLDGLTDVTITTPSQGNALTYDAALLEWVNSDLSESFEGLYGMKEITSLTNDLNDYKTAGTYYKSATDFSTVNGPSNTNTTRLILTVKTFYDGDQYEVRQEVLYRDGTTTAGVSSYWRNLTYNTNTSTWSYGSWNYYLNLSDLTNYDYYAKQYFCGLYGFTEITSLTNDLNSYTTVGNYYKSATDFSLAHTPSSNATARCFLSVSKMFSTNDDVIIQHILIQPSTGAQAVREWYRTATKSGGTWTFVNWQRNATQSSLESTAGFWSSTVSCLVGDTSATFTDTTYSSSWTFDAYCDDGTGEPIAISKIEVNASDQAVVTFASGLTNATSVKLHYWH